ncbi:MAG: hypothetical protein QM747_18030 [Nocardioides sp.]
MANTTTPSTGSQPAPPLLPTAAERARTVLAGTTSLRLGILNLADDVEAHLVAKDGSIWMLPAAGSPARVLGCAGQMPTWAGTATALDLASVPHPDRLRGRVTLTGRVEAVTAPKSDHVRQHLARLFHVSAEPNGPVLRMTPARVVLEWFCEALDHAGRSQTIHNTEYRQAYPDPFVECEADWLTHLHLHHAAAVHRLAQGLASAPGGDLIAANRDSDVRPLLVDRHGLVLRIYPRRPSGSPYDLRLAFDRTVTCACQGTAALDALWRRAGLDPDLETRCST